MCSKSKADGFDKCLNCGLVFDQEAKPPPVGDERVQAFLLEQGGDGIDTIAEWFSTVIYSMLNGEHISGKRPVGDSDWDWYIEEALKKHDLKPKDVIKHIEACLKGESR
jgi:hypothetical protein